MWHGRPGRAGHGRDARATKFARHAEISMVSSAERTESAEKKHFSVASVTSVVRSLCKLRLRRAELPAPFPKPLAPSPVSHVPKIENRNRKSNIPVSRIPFPVPRFLRPPHHFRRPANPGWRRCRNGQMPNRRAADERKQRVGLLPARKTRAGRARIQRPRGRTSWPAGGEKRSASRPPGYPSRRDDYNLG